MNFIIAHLKHSLEELDLAGTKVDLTKLLELKSMLNLKELNCTKGNENDLKNLKKQIPHVKINTRARIF